MVARCGSNADTWPHVSTFSVYSTVDHTSSFDQSTGSKVHWSESHTSCCACCILKEIQFVIKAAPSLKLMSNHEQMVSVADGGHRYPCWAHFKERPFKDWTLLRLWINFPLIFPLSFWQHLRPLWPHLWPRLIINLQPKQKMHFFYGWASFSAGWLAHFRAHELKNGRSTQRGVTHAPLSLSLSLSTFPFSCWPRSDKFRNDP